MRGLRTTSALLVLAACASPAAGSDCGTLEPLEWLLGEWRTDGVQSTMRESWVARGPQTWEGRGVEISRADHAVTSSESLRLVEMSGQVFYVAKVAGNELPVAFRLTECDDGRFVFANPAHDFPRQLVYQRVGQDRLKVRVSDGADSGFTLDFTRASAAAAVPESVLAAEDARFAAMIAADADALRRWLAEELVYVHSTGVAEGREQLITAISSGNLQYHAVEPAERRVVFLAPDVALVQGAARIRARSGAQELDFRARYLAIYGMSGDAWRLRAWQSLRLP